MKLDETRERYAHPPERTESTSPDRASIVDDSDSLCPYCGKFSGCSAVSVIRGMEWDCPNCGSGLRASTTTGEIVVARLDKHKWRPETWKRIVDRDS